MKTGGLMTGGWMRNRYLEAFARYYLKYLQEYKKEGIKIQALTTQNECETDQYSLMPACYWHPESEMSFLGDYLAPLLKENGMEDMELWIVDHNYILWRRAKWMLDDSKLKGVVKGAAFHPYEGTADMMTRLHEAHPEIDIHMTEEGTFFDTGIEAVCKNGSGFIDMMKNWSRSIFCWNIALDEMGKPNIGPFFQMGGKKVGGAIEIHSKTREVIYGCQYWALGHFSRYVDRNAVRIESHCDVEGINQVAFENPDGEYVVVIVNSGGATELSLELKDRYAQVQIPEECMCTLIFK
jgi:glucosylceramidase